MKTVKTVKITAEYLAYLEAALAFAIDKGFKTKVFDSSGKIIGVQG